MGGGKGCQLTQEKNAAVQELTSEQQRLDQTEIIFSLRKNGGYIHSSLGDRSVLVVRQAGKLAGSLFVEFSKSCNLTSNASFQCLNTFMGLIKVHQ